MKLLMKFDRSFNVALMDFFTQFFLYQFVQERNTASYEIISTSVLGSTGSPMILSNLGFLSLCVSGWE